jgi:hypothetical protein
VSPTGASPADQYDFPGNAFPTGVIQFYPGVTSAELTINVVGDSMKESNETFRVTLSNPSNATIGRATANGTITNDDGSGKGAAAAASEAIAAMETDAGQPAIVVADPLWFFVPPELLTPEQLAVPVITWINGVRHVGDLADEFDHGRELRGDHFGGEASPGMDAAAAGLMMARRADCGSVGAPHVVAPAAPDVAALASSSMPLPTPGPAVSSDDSLTDLLAKLRSRRSRKEIEGWQEAIDSVLAAWDA